MEEITVDGRVLAFTVLIVIATAILFGLVPALRCAGPPVGQSLIGKEVVQQLQPGAPAACTARWSWPNSPWRLSS